jgi:hypothetical protein
MSKQIWNKDVITARQRLRLSITAWLRLKLIGTKHV